METPLPITLKEDFKIICTSCKKGTPAITLIQENGLFLQMNCQLCDYSSKSEVSVFLNEIIKANSEIAYYCQKKGGIHKNRKATKYVNGLFYCDECDEVLNELIDNNAFIDISMIKEQCKEHKRPFKTYCTQCMKNMCESCKIQEHQNFKHQIIYFNNMIKNINKNKMEEKIKN